MSRDACGSRVRAVKIYFRRRAVPRMTSAGIAEFVLDHGGKVAPPPLLRGISIPSCAPVRVISRTCRSVDSDPISRMQIITVTSFLFVIANDSYIAGRS